MIGFTPESVINFTGMRTERHQETLAPLMTSAEGRANLVPDVHLAALAVEHGLVLCSTDGDFVRSDGFQWVNPLRR